MTERLVRAWATLLSALYPPTFRESVGTDLRRLLEDGAGVARRTSAWALTVFVARNTIISLRDAALEWVQSPARWARSRRAGGPRFVWVLRNAMRGLVRRPGNSIPALLTLALGIGATTAMFSVLYGVILQPLPYSEADRIVEVFGVGGETGDSFASFSLPDIRDWSERTRALGALGAFTTLPSDRILSDVGDAVELETAYVTPGFFESLAVAPQLGRFFTEDDTPGDDRVFVASHAFWLDVFGGDSGAVGRALTLDGESYQMLGVMPANFDFPSADVEVWVPLSVIPSSSIPFEVRDVRLLNAIGRLANGVDHAAAEEDLAEIARALSEEYPDTNSTLTDATVRPLHEGLVGDVRWALTVLMGAAALVLILVCANLANLALVRESRRVPDFAVRAALGATRSHRIGLVTAESLLLALIGGGVGLVLAAWGTDALVSINAGAIPRAHTISTDWRLAVFAFTGAVITALVSSIVPSLRAGRASLAGGLRAAGRSGGARRGGGALVMSQVALSVVLLVGAALLLRSLWSLSDTDPGFEPRGLVVAEITFPSSRYPDSSEYLARYDETLAALASIPGVSAVGTIRRFPFRGNGETTRLVVPGITPPNAPGLSVTLLQVSPGLLGTMGIDLVEGSDFGADAGSDGRDVAIVSEELARQAFGGEDAVGRMLDIDGGLVVEVIGVVGEVRQVALAQGGVGTVYVPQHWLPRRGAAFVLRTEGNPTAVVAAVRDVVRRQDAEQPITLLSAASDITRGELARPAFFAALLSAFAGLAMLLSVVGIYGVVAAGVARRSHEIGIRMAVGADAKNVRSLILREGMRPVIAGLAVGLVAAVAAARLLESLLYGIAAVDPLTYGIAIGSLATIAAVACVVPAWIASETDPVRTLGTQ